MKYNWLNKKQNNKLIIFFNGWGMDDLILSKLDCEDYDVLNIYDYNNLELDINLEEYSEKYVVAWSMGVMIATLFNFGEIARIALCGTTKPIDNNYGIPEKIYNLTIKGFNEKSVQKFNSRMFLGKSDMIKFSNRELNNQKTELISLLNYQANKDYKYTKALIPEKDLIIPTKNQIDFWKVNNTKYKMISTGHCPFNIFKSWSEILVDI